MANKGGTEKEREITWEIRIEFQCNCFILLNVPAYITSENVSDLSNNLCIISTVLQITWK